MTGAIIETLRSLKGALTLNHLRKGLVIMPDLTTTKVAATALKRLNTRSESGTVELAASDLTKPGAVSVKGGVLSIQNEKLANLIHTKLADASRLVPGGLAAADVDVSVGVKVK
ncbi:hypothetical protein [Sphingomonas sp. PR090111-T3T-6A]|uniref:hypothetical protein n=1 Tax=Sphingomonas sp. PR090111-T3T-6A TaxID=685778 RepID=UPI0003762558|nr:hypothetical protein [Sphingomonas sp. PR090111-T3T-6A]